jgi:signal-transduction protein with cAMP-binding, CBS, and nucleotidyltransferase domain
VIAERPGDLEATLQRLDSFPYRHRAGDVMSRPLLTADLDWTLLRASRLMGERGVSSLVVLDASGRAAAIVTERDVLTGVAREGPAALERPIDAVASRPVVSIRVGDFVYVAIGRMDRLGLRHLVVEDGDGKAVGMVTARQLLRQRAGGALAVGDRIVAASDAEALAAARAEVPGLARAMLAEGLPAHEVAEVIGATVRDLTARAAALAASAMAGEGWGPPPAAWAVLVLGSGGRGESLLGSDQDNAIVHAGTAAGDPWYAELGRRMADTLNRAGIPFCSGGVMAREPAWRRTLDEWQHTVERWIAAKSGEALLAVDIFYDFRAVYGDTALAERLRIHALAAAKDSMLFLRLLGQELERIAPPIGWFGQFATVAGRIDVKMPGLFPIVAATRILALRHGIPATSTAERLVRLAEAGTVSAVDRDGLLDAHRLLLNVILDQQIADLDSGLKPSTRVAVAPLSRSRKQQLKAAFRRAHTFAAEIQTTLS